MERRLPALVRRAFDTLRLVSLKPPGGAGDVVACAGVAMPALRSYSCGLLEFTKD